jgi:hypothetical protein
VRRKWWRAIPCDDVWVAGDSFYFIVVGSVTHSQIALTRHVMELDEGYGNGERL